MKQDEIVEAVRAGRAEFQWFRLSDDLEVFADALKIDGVRVTVSAETAQRCADILGASLTTPAIEDEVYQRASVRLPAFTDPHGPDTDPERAWEQTLQHNRKIEAQLAQLGGVRPGDLIATVGKSWVLTNALEGKLVEGTKQQAACNYGWHSPNAPYAPATGAARVWQGMGFRHNIFHTDYSQTLRCARGRLVSHEGVLRVLRQPGVRIERDTEPPSSTSATDPMLPAANVLVLPEVTIIGKAPKPSMTKGDVAGVAFLQARNYSKASRKNGDVKLVVIHTAECGETPNAARNLAKWAAGAAAPKASWHFAVDSESIVQSVLEKDVAWHAPGANSTGIGIEHAGRAAQQAADWKDPYSTAVLERSARLVAGICQRWGIPVERLGVEDIKAGSAGLCGHVDVSNAFRKSDHTDPGKAFPWDRYLELVRAAS